MHGSSSKRKDHAERNAKSKMHKGKFKLFTRGGCRPTNGYFRKKRSLWNNRDYSTGIPVPVHIDPSEITCTGVANGDETHNIKAISLITLLITNVYSWRNPSTTPSINIRDEPG